ncbi:pyridoxamine 5'-phosphate oxidase family protein [Psychroserpens sp.]|uniref:pyridoxamine 5'-phosphate oxidase family protein n=1 Tax=Psychroserpens sp. TaxID=2020870 RepID=UPI003C791217
MTNQYLEEAKRELINGHAKKRHPFRYFVLATSQDGIPRQRTVVLRKSFLDLSLLFYTDSRTQKINDIKHNAALSALFYHPKKLLQIRVEGKAEIITDQAQIDTYWHTIQASSKKDYTTKLAPSTPINAPENVNYIEDQHHFCAVKLIPTTIEYLQLSRPNHIRVLFSKQDEDWSGQFLVP